ncbi:hypothetical protein [Streptantibioticus ferralitis]|uniref:Uncharacterized protein n=1 Tax=Streptantibioticus ferralitis TaxID=236510 RepID=A0ABT5YS65_9ACTN|nr:hypothetical protein [Streptantibioticus ferralitis]MDF2254440.1 hypothetical protein [Streptantibioticus ferralitis]
MLEAGAVVRDVKTDRVGVVIGMNDGRVSLRPAGGGAPWSARRVDVCPAGPMEELRARVAEVNAWSGWGR